MSFGPTLSFTLEKMEVGRGKMAAQRNAQPAGNELQAEPKITDSV